MLDALYRNGKIYTLREEGECFEAVGIKDGKIAFLGTNAEAESQKATETFDMNGKTMIPGMGDSHMHFYAYCQTFTQVNLSDCKSKKEAFEMLRARAAETPKGEWIRGANFDQTKWTDCEDVLPTRWELDEISTDHPIVIKRVCLHMVVANSKALEIAGIDKDYVPDAGGSVDREPDGTPNGVLREQLTKIFDDIIPDPLDDDKLKKEIMARELKTMASMGNTMMHTYAAEIWHYFEDIEDYKDLDANGQLPLRVAIYSDHFETLDGNLPEWFDASNPYQKVKMGGYKLFCDGSLGSRSAALMEPYSDDPSTMGIIVETEESLEQKMKAAAKKNIQVAVHAIGDRAMDIVITAMEKTYEELKASGQTDEEIASKRPFRLIHAQMSTPELVKRMAKLPLIVDAQPTFVQADRHWIIERIGPERVKYAYPWKTYENNGILVTGGSDSPVETFNPLVGIYNAIAHPNESERLTPYEAVCVFSKNIPYATCDEDLYGTIEIGKFADVAILDKDIFHTAVDEILQIKVMKTLLAGKETWSCM